MLTVLCYSCNCWMSGLFEDVQLICGDIWEENPGAIKSATDAIDKSPLPKILGESSLLRRKLGSSALYSLQVGPNHHENVPSSRLHLRESLTWGRPPALTSCTWNLSSGPSSHSSGKAPAQEEAGTASGRI